MHQMRIELLPMIASVSLLAWVEPLLAAEPSSKINDPLVGAVDPLLLEGERGKFLRAAGADSEITKEEFDVDGKRTDGFVRPFDRWEQLAKFDHDHNRTIDWTEALAYRQAMR